MSESGQGGDQRSWWEKPDEAAERRSEAETTAVPSDAGDPYRQAPTQSVPQHPGPGAPADPAGSAGGWSSPQEQPQPPQWGGQNSQPPVDYPPLTSQDGRPRQEGLPRYGDPVPGGQGYDGQGYGAQSYGGQSSGGQSYGAPSYAGPNQAWAGQNGYPQQAPVAGAAHAVLWTAVGGLVFFGTGLGWIAAIVALALVPGARRSILESGGSRRGLGYLLAGKIVAWATIGLTVLLAIGLAVIVGVGLFSAGTTSGYDVGTVGVDTVGVLLPASRA